MKDLRGLLEFPHPFVHDQKKIFYVFSEVNTTFGQKFAVMILFKQVLLA